VAKPTLQLVDPTYINGSVPSGKGRKPPLRRPNAEVRTREYLTEPEIERLREAAKGNRNAHRDATMVLVAYRHGLRPIELVQLRWEQVEFQAGRIHIARAKNSMPAVHLLPGVVLRALRRLQREQDPPSPFVFTSERGAPFTTRGFRTMVQRLSVAAGFDFTVHPHMFRHACGYKLANDGVDTRSLQAYLGHKNINHTVRYAELSPNRFRNFWRD
jgi:integrase